MTTSGLGAAIVRREELPRAAPRALDVEQQRLLLQAAEECTARDRAIVALLLFTGLRLSEAAALQVTDLRISARKALSSRARAKVTRTARSSSTRACAACSTDGSPSAQGSLWQAR